jgi:hypothetical protein
LPGTAPPQNPTSTYAWSAATRRFTANASTSTVGGMLMSGISTIVVTPPDHCQLHLVQLALDAGAVLVDRPQRQELIANREEPAPRGGARLPEERVPLDAVVHLSSAHSFAVHE